MTPREYVARLRAQIARHEDQLWWAHSLYALALGVVFMWLGSRHFTWLRVAAVHVVVIWALSLVLANYVDRADHTSPWWARLRVVINYVTKNFYQQILFFILPIYAASTTVRSRNILFVVLLAASAVVSTLDIVYDRHVAARRRLAGLFFAFNLFAAVNVALPVLWSVSNVTAFRAGSLAALAGYFTIALHPSQFAHRRAWWRISAGTLVVVAAMEFGRSFVPPAPIRLAGTEFGLGFNPARFEIVRPVAEQPGPAVARVYVVTRVQAPMGLRDDVAIRWYHGDRLVNQSGRHEVVGGRREGFRLWSSMAVPPGRPAAAIRFDLVTRGGQLIGRAWLPAAASPDGRVARPPDS